MKQKQKGFTLAEVLIALSLIVILSIVAINTLRNRDNTQEYTAKRDKAVMNMEGAIHQAMFDDRREILSGLDDYKDALTDLSVRTGSSGEYILRDGTVYTIEEGDGSSYYGKITIDVNGDLAPNEDGTDIFTYYVSSGGNLLLSGGSTDDDDCDDGEVLINGTCMVKVTCPDDTACTKYTYNSSTNSCTASCNSGCLLVNGVCTLDDTGCDDDEVEINGVCEKKETCPDDTTSTTYTYDSSTNSCTASCNSGYTMSSSGVCEIKKYTVTASATNGTVVPESQTATEGQTVYFTYYVGTGYYGCKAVKSSGTASVSGNSSSEYAYEFSVKVGPVYSDTSISIKPYGTK